MNTEETSVAGALERAADWIARPSRTTAAMETYCRKYNVPLSRTFDCEADIVLGIVRAAITKARVSSNEEGGE